MMHPGPGQVTPDLSYDQIIEQLETLFAGDWRGRMEEIASLMRAFRSKGVLLRHFLTQTAGSDAWPALSGAQSFLLHAGRSLLIRLNLWLPEKDIAFRTEEYAKYLSIDQPHNHSFSFFTTTIMGAGYTADFFRVPETRQTLQKGDQISVENLTEVELTGAAVMYVPKDCDFHRQRWPGSKTMTINVIPVDPTAFGDIQYIVDLESMTVKNVIDTSVKSNLPS